VPEVVSALPAVAVPRLVRLPASPRCTGLEAWWFDLIPWMTTFGGTAFDDSGKAVFDEDAKSQAALTWLFNQMESGRSSRR
jgi:ABC-type glycerol-3-phosphate transport system substrate-binding protein